MCLHKCVYYMYMGASRGLKVLDSPELALKKVVSCHAGDEI